MFEFTHARRVLAGATLVATIAAGGAVGAQEIIEVLLDRARLMEMPAGTTTLVVGNPGIADVTLLRRQNRIVLTAKAFGETNVIALDANGQSLAETIVRVIAADHALVVQRGLERESYSCNPRCQPTVNLGDAMRYMNDTIGQVGQRNAYATPGSAPAPPLPAK